MANQADFIVSNIAVPAVVDWTDTFQLSFTIKNTGLGTAGISYSGYRFDDAPVYQGDEGTLVYSRWGIESRGSLTFSVSVDSLGLAPGEHTIWVAADILSENAESDETNNLASATFTVGPAVAKPDLLISTSQVSAPPWVVTNGTLNFSYFLTNAGTGDADGTTTYFRLDQQPTSSSFSTSQAAAALAAGESAEYSSSISVAGLSNGTHTLWLYADGANTELEKSDANNWTSVSFQIVNNKADLVVSTLATAQGSVVQGEDLDIIYSIMNIGPRTAPHGGWVWYRIDGQPSYAEHRDITMAGELAYGESQTLSYSIPTAGLSPGRHTLWLETDPTNLIGENNEGNNLKSVTFTVTAAAPQSPDQIIESITGPATIVQGADVSFTYVLKDANAANTANSYGTILFAVDRQPTSSDYDYNVGAGALPGGGSLSLSEVLHTNLSVGQHTLWIKADGLNTVTESNENNNLKAYTFTVTAAAPNPDLAMASLDGATSVVQGQALTLTYRIENLGSLASSVSKVGVMIDHEADATHYISTPTLGALTAGGSQSLTAVIDTSSLTVGFHRVWLTADVFGTVTEVSEWNNWGSFGFMVTEAPLRPDLVVSSIDAPSSILKGQTFDFSYVVKNIGTASVEGNLSAFAIDHIPVTPGVGEVDTIGTLAPGASEGETSSFSTANLSIGQHTLYVMADYSGMMTEADEVNNWTSVTFNVLDPTPPAAPDLAVKSIAPDVATLSQGQSLNFGYVLQNFGGAFSTAATAAYWIDGNPISGTFGFNLGTSGETAEIRGTAATAGLSIGQHTLWIDADYLGSLDESNEANNRSSITFTVTAALQADLVVSSLTAGASVAQGNAFNFSYVIQNEGQAPAATSWSAFRIDAQPDASHYTGVHAIDTLSGGASQSITKSIDTAGLALGEHVLWVKADAIGGVAEGDENNNWRSVAFTVTGPPQADLVASSVTVWEDTVVQGQNLGFDLTIVNNGTAGSGASYAGIYVDVLDGAHFRGYNFTSALGVGASSTASNGFSTAGLSIGQHTLWIGADNFGQTVEGNENNNWRSVTFEVTAPPQADLVASSLNVWNATVAQGQNLGFDFTIVNDGAARAGAGYAGVYVDVLDGAHFLGYNFTDALGVGESRTLSNGFSTAGLGVGQHTLWIGADNFGQTVEGNENNNWRSVTFEVTAPPQADLVASSLNVWNATVAQGQNLGFDFTIVNDGAARAGAGYAGVYVDVLDGAHFLGYNFTDALGVGESRTLSNGFSTAGLGVGQHTLWIGADNFGQTVEGNENNNWRSVTFEVTAPPQADLVASSLNVWNATVAQGQNLGFDFTIVNDGAARAGAGYAGVYVDVLDGAHFLGYNFTDALGVGESRTLSNGFSTAGLGVGQHTLWIGADNFGQTVEGNENNNWRSVTFEVTAPPQADLVASSLNVWNATVAQGQNLGFDFTIVNDGAARAGAGYAGVYVDVLDGAHFLGYNFTDALGVGESRTLSNGFSTAGLGVGQHTLWIGADNFGQTVEGNENNNWRSVTFEVTAPHGGSGGAVVTNRTSSTLSGGTITLMSSDGLDHHISSLTDWMVS